VSCAGELLLGPAAGAGGGAFKQARQAESKGRYSDAYLLYAEAVAREPDNPRYRAHMMAVQRRGLENLDIQLPARNGAPLDESDPLPAIEPEDYAEAREMRSPPVLRGAAGAQDHDLTGGGKELFEKVFGAYGVQVVFDSEYQDPPPQRFRLEGATFGEALRALEAVTNSFAVPVHESIALVARDNAQKRTQVEPYMSVLVPFPEPMSAQEVQEGVRAVQTTFDMTKVGIDNARGLVLFRDRVSRLKPALDLFHQLMTHRAQAVIEVEILSYDDRSAISYGLRLPTSFPIVHFGRVWNSTPQIPAGFVNFLAFGGGRTLFGVGLAGAQMFADMTRTSTRSLQRVHLRGVDSQPVSIHVGDRYPVITAAFIGTPGEEASLPFPQIQFEELGLVVKVTPRIHSPEEISMQIEVELKALAGEAANGIPVIANRALASTVRMRMDEIAVIAGLSTQRDSRSSSGLPLPFPLRANTFEKEDGQFLVTLRPRLVSMPPTETATPPIPTGSETRPRTPVE
jgi:general secretion pathway protein D